MAERLRRAVESGLWALLILLLPMTSLPLLSRLAGGTMVAPAAVIPLALLMLVYLLPYLMRGGGLPRQVMPVLAFFLAAVFSCGLSFFFNIPLFREIDRMSNTLTALATSLIGICFYLLAISWPDSPGRLSRLYFWLNVSGLVVILWSGLQAAVWHLQGAYPDWMWDLQRLVSSSGNLYDRRVTGLAFEPSWLGNQLVLLFLPYWLAATIRRTSAGSFRLWGLTIENILLGLGAGVLLLALSRSAIISFILAVAWLLLRFTGNLVARVERKILSRPTSGRRFALPGGWIRAAVWAGVILLSAGILTALIFAATRLDTRMSDLFTLLQLRPSFTELAYELVFGERVVFWNAGLEVFSDHPFFGVGLGNAGYFFPEKMTAFGWTVAESFKMYYSSALPNTLSLWVRLLAETGMVGFSFFIAWLVVLWKSARYLESHSNPVLRTAGLAGQLAVIALLMEGMSVDTLALPYYWLSFGWLSAAAALARRSEPSGQAEWAAEPDTRFAPDNHGIVR